MVPSGAYNADRSAALSGVPKSTIHYWARTGVLVPSVSAIKIKLWSYSDLLGLRFIYWLRRQKHGIEGRSIPPTSMHAIRLALAQLDELDLEIFEEEGRPSILVSMDGEVHVWPRGEAPRSLSGQIVAEELLDLVAPFQTAEGLLGPDLVRPGLFVRIIPGKLSGAPHIVETRVETESLFALERRGFDPEAISSLYPDIERPAIDDGLQVERGLAENLRRAA